MLLVLLLLLSNFSTVFSTPTSLEDLPPAILETITSNLNDSSFRHFSQTSRALRQSPTDYLLRNLDAQNLVRLIQRYPNVPGLKSAILNSQVQTTLNLGLIECIVQQNVELLEFFLQHKSVSVHAFDDGALMAAVQTGRLDIVRMIINTGADVNARHGSAIILASKGGHTEIVRLLLDLGARQGLDDAVSFAASRGSLAIVKLLVVYGADIHAFHDISLIWACENGHVYVVQYLVALGSQVDAQNGACLWMSSRNGHSNLVKVLLEEFDADVSLRDHSALIDAVKKNHVEIVRMLLEHGADVHAKGDFAIQSSVLYGSTDMVRVLLGFGANVHVNDDLPLRDACFFFLLDKVDFLLQFGADVHAHEDFCIRWAASKGRLKLVRLLANNGANLRAKYDYPIRWALRNRHLKVVRYLLIKGAPMPSLWSRVYGLWND